MHFTLCDMIADLVQNAVEAKANHIEIQLIQTDKNFTFFIKDNGIGMKKEELCQVSNPFFTNGNKHPLRHVGLGIPFFIQTVEVSNGKYEISSTYGKGTSLYAKINLKTIDTPPVGDIPGLFRLLVTMPDMLDNLNCCEVLINRIYIESEILKRNYQISRKKLLEKIGTFDSVNALVFLEEYCYLQEHSENKGRS